MTQRRLQAGYSQRAFLKPIRGAGEKKYPLIIYAFKTMQSFTKQRSVYIVGRQRLGIVRASDIQKVLNHMARSLS